jgi:YVTN family beta-propeller protein
MRSNRRLGACLALILALSLPLASAEAREAFVANGADGTVSVIEAATATTVATIAVGSEPSDVAISPDGSRAYVTNTGDGSVSVIDVRSRQKVGSPISVGGEPRGIAISVDGTRAYVANTASDTVSVIDVPTSTVVATVPLGAGTEPEGIAVTPDGAAAFVAQRANDVALITTATNTVAGSVKVAAGLGPFRLALTPDGGRGFLSNANSSTATIFSTITSTVLGSPVLIGPNPAGVAVNPHESRAYVTSQGAGTVTALDTVTHNSVGPPVPGFDFPAQIAVAPGGAQAYVTDEGGSTVTILDALANGAVGKINVGNAPQGVAFVPDQGPVARFAVTSPSVKAGQPATFDASASSDRDGRVALYSWEFGDGEVEITSNPTTEHTYARAGLYTPALTVIDQEKCSAVVLFTGQTITCNGSAAARTSVALEAIDVTPPEFLFFAHRRQRLSHRLLLVGRCPQERCRASASGSLRTALKTPKRKLRGKFKLRPVSTLLANGVERKMRLRLSGRVYRTARRALIQEGSATVKVRASGRDAAGNKTRRVLKIRLYMPKKRGARK